MTVLQTWRMYSVYRHDGSTSIRVPFYMLYVVWGVVWIYIFCDNWVRNPKNGKCPNYWFNKQDILLHLKSKVRSDQNIYYLPKMKKAPKSGIWLEHGFRSGLWMFVLKIMRGCGVRPNIWRQSKAPLTRGLRPTKPISLRRRRGRKLAICKELCTRAGDSKVGP